MTQAGAAPKMPLWVKVSIAVGLVLILAAVAVAILGPGGHGPRLHEQ